MNLVSIDPSNEPHCLIKLRKGGFSYTDLKDECKAETIAILDNSQKDFCAYCEQKSKSNTFIEHYIPQSKAPHLQLVFTNFLGICSGKDYFNPKVSKRSVSHCGDNRGNADLSIDPKDSSHIDEIFYEADATIRSTIEEHDKDLNDTLNLNHDNLKRKREEAFKRNIKNLLDSAAVIGLPKEKILHIGLLNADNGYSEFAKYIKFRFLKLKDST